MVRNQVLSWFERLGRQDHQCFAEVPSADRHDRWTADRVAATMAGYLDEHAELRTDGPAQCGQWFAVTEHPDHWDIHQCSSTPTRTPAGRSTPQVDLVRSREEERPVVELVRLGRTGD